MESNNSINQQREDELIGNEQGIINQDDLIIKQQEAIDQEITTTIPLINAIEPLLNLKQEYSDDDDVYLKKLTTLSTTYPSYRRIRPDGNCFYRAFSFKLLEYLLLNTTQLELESFIEKFKLKRELLTAVGFNQFTVEDFYECFLELLTKLQTPQITTIADLEEVFSQDQSVADYLVVYLRILTSAELKSNAEFYQNFIAEQLTVDEFCSLEVEPMYKESDHIHIIGLSRVLGVGVRVEYVDRGSHQTTHNFPDEESTPIVILLYRPGHYDILYQRQEGEGQGTKVTQQDDADSTTTTTNGLIPSDDQDQDDITSTT